VSCALCGGVTQPHLEKAGPAGAIYQIHRCENCTVWQIQPLPTAAELVALYQSTYFEQRSDRGYADYTSEKVYRSVVATLQKNLADLRFYPWEKLLGTRRRLLEVGCASGHAVAYFTERGWDALGVDVAAGMVEAGKSVGRNLVCADFLTFDFADQKFELITHWATLEHLREPQAFLRRMRDLLSAGGKIYLSTCNTGFFARRYGTSWRYLNVPEHVYYFNHKSLSLLASACGLRITRAFSYGSGFTTKDNATWTYRWSKTIADRLARRRLSGDMIVIELQHA
jgi:SAM-dependent methyltransferase